MKHIIFDLGNVLVRLDAEACRRAFQEAGMGTLVERSNNEARTILNQLGLGIITAEEFCQKARELSGSQASDEVIYRAANAMLVEIPY